MPSARLGWVTLKFKVGAVAIKASDGHIRPSSSENKGT